MTTSGFLPGLSPHSHPNSTAISISQRARHASVTTDKLTSPDTIPEPALHRDTSAATACVPVRPRVVVELTTADGARRSSSAARPAPATATRSPDYYNLPRPEVVPRV